MKITKKLFFTAVLLGVLIISGCGKKAAETPEPVNPSANLATTSWITDPIRSTQSDLTIELLHVTQSSDGLVFRVKFPLPDWRNWYISKIKLTVVGESETVNAQTKFFERLYRKDLENYCLYQPSYNEEERCLSVDEMDTYQIDSLIFSDIPEDLTGKQIVLEILELSTENLNCEKLPLAYIENVVSQDFPGLTLECASGGNAVGFKISEASGFADNPEAIAAVETLVTESTSGRISGPWIFELSK